jgi:LmbE family N-acetylglucosaminyl deacetylase
VRADAFLAALEAAPVVDLDDLTDGRGLVVLAPHPDDESLGCGGLIAQACARGREVRLLILTDGSGSHPTSPDFTSQMLRDLREAETLAAAAALGLPAEHVAFMRLQDAWVPSAGPVAEEAARSVAAAAASCAAGAVFTTWRHDPHCDHKAAAAIVDLARPALDSARILGFSVWGASLPPQTEVGPAPVGYRLEIGPEREAKRRAIAAHVSQTKGLAGEFPDAFRLQDAMIDRMCGPHESYFEERPKGERR